MMGVVTWPGWLIIVPGLVTWAYVGRGLLIEAASEELRDRSAHPFRAPQNEPLLDGRDYAYAAIWGLIAAGCWPLTLVAFMVWTLYRLTCRGRRWFNPVEYDYELQRRERAELERLRALEREYGLPVVD